MNAFSQIRGRIADRFKERGIDRLVYFHCDHFEPWSRIGNRSVADPANVADVVAFADQCSRIDFARRLTLFYRTYHDTAHGLRQDLIRARPDDPFGFISNRPHEEQAFRAAMKHVVETVDHSIQVHIHHEGFTSHSGHTAPEWVAYSNSPEAAALDAERLALAVRLAKDAIRKETDIKLREWFFVHGMWALQGSDPTACRIADELGILMREGCRGDFTFPAARVHVNPKIEMPYFCNAVPSIRGYDEPESEPEPAFDNPAAAERKFFVWASRVKSGWSSLDYYSETVRQRLENPEAWATELIRDSFYVQGTLFLKTHAHSMQPEYREAARLPIPPHAHPGVQTLLSLIFDGAALADVDIRFATVPEIYDLLVNQGAVWNGHDSSAQPEASDSTEAAALAGAASPVVADGARVAHGAEPSDALTGSAANSATGIETNASGFLREGSPKEAAAKLIGSAERLNRVACRAMAARIAALGVIPSGAYDHYVKAVKAGQLLGPVEIAVVDVLESLPPFDEYHEVRARLGVLAMLIATTGRTAVAIESDRLRHAASAAVFDAAAAEFPDVRPRFSLVRGRFPQIVEARTVKRSLAIFTDFIATIDETEVLDSLGRYGAALIDIDRFGVQLTTDDERARVLSRFRAAGFEVIRPLLDLGGQGRYYLVSSAPVVAVNVA